MKHLPLELFCKESWGLLKMDDDRRNKKTASSKKLGKWWIHPLFQHMVRSHRLRSNRRNLPKIRIKAKEVAQRQPYLDAEDPLEGTSAAVTTPNFTEEIRAVVQECLLSSIALSEPNKLITLRHQRLTQTQTCRCLKKRRGDPTWQASRSIRSWSHGWQTARQQLHPCDVWFKPW